MNETSTTELEREAEAARERVADTAETIRKKLTTGQLIDEFTGMLTGGDMAGTLNNLKSQIRDNPIPAVLVGAGLAWLAFGKGIAASTSSGMTTPQPARGSGGSQGGAGHSLVDEASSAVGSAAGSVADRARSAASSVSHAVSDMAGSLSDTADRLRQSMLTGSSDSGPHMSRSVSNLTTHEPLLIAVAGLAVGAAIGALLPASDLEKEQLGPEARRLREQAADLVEKGKDSATRVATKAYDALKDEADRQGLSPSEGSSLGQKVGDVVRSAAEATQDAARHEMGVDHAGSTQRR